MPMNYFSGQTVTPTYTDPIMSIPGSANISRTTRLFSTHHQKSPGTQCHTSVLSPARCSTDMYSVGKTGRDRYISPVRPIPPNRSDRSYRPVRPVHPVSLFQTSVRYLHPHSQILRVISIKCLLIIRMIWLICLEKVLEWMLEAKPAHTKSRILLRLIRLHTLLVLGCLSLLNSVGKIVKVPFEHISQYLAQLGKLVL